MDSFPSFSPDRYSRYAQFLGLTVLGICALVFAGWAWYEPILTESGVALYQMKVNTIIGLACGAVSLWLHIGKHRRLAVRRAARGLAGLMAAIGLLNMIQYLFDVNVGIDELLQRDPYTAANRNPGRMSVPTSCGMIITGATLLMLQQKRWSSRGVKLAAVSMFAWTGLAVAYLYGLASLYEFNAYGGIAIPTVACFILLNAGILLAQAQQGFMFYFTNRSYAGLAARRLLPTAIITPILLNWLVLLGHEVGMIDIRTALAIETIIIALVLTLVVGWCARSLLAFERLVSIKQSEKMQALEKAARLAHYDGLTGLPNRVLLNERLGEAIKAAGRKAGSVSLLFIDLDRFKPINDTHGHQAGDNVLIQIGQRLRDVVRESDTVARLGGDEFVVLLAETRANDDAGLIAGKLITAIEQPYKVGEDEMYLSASIGISVFPKDGMEPQALMEHADAAMYYAKSLGKRNYQFYAPHMTHEAVRRASIERQMRIALEEGGFAVEYQPKVSVSNGRLIGVEALVRFKPTDGRPPISPVEFIPIAEESGLIVPLGRWVLEEACRQNKAWQDAGYLPLQVSVNVSAAQFRSGNFADLVHNALKSTGLSPAYLDLEITETTVMQNFEYAIKLMRQLQGLGVSVSIDDFGTGSSSLSKLKLFSADTLKIDRSFIRDLPDDRDDAAITCAIIDLARNLNQRVIAEGVETKEQFAFLQEHGCDEVQGFYFSAPLPAEKFESMYARQW
ncbi:EAL domain-containing protein [Noviherbaspirillum sp. CPCC 100848]|uniref:EAL domain-containing protein n=1 Tax=Noviherbaspirillum album TaxID=3080276 RepID=A0ABU6JDI3_9BURK|nr:EAL domain-containing protein [Noviherbaspirillum sp. CPCC 100848]MEC4721711.1 EAL domain-containing protein [Noviherbaspirillum sp. CPCC 100848]